MNCKPGDLARVVPGYRNSNLLVQILNHNPEASAAYGEHFWHVEVLGFGKGNRTIIAPGAVIDVGEVPVTPGMRGFSADRILRPIPPEELSEWVEKVEGIPHATA